MTKTAPHDHDAEAAVLGIVLYTCPPDVIERALSVLDPGDFHHPAHAATWQAVASLHATGRPVDVWTVADELRVHGQADKAGEPARFLADAPLASRVDHYCGIVVAHARRRLLQRAALAAAAAVEEGADPDDTADTLLAALADLDRPDPDQIPDRLTTIRDFLDRPGENRAPWVIPALLRLDWRAVIVAPEGTGKSVVLRSLAGYAAQGVHPFTGESIEPVRALVVDLENPDEPLDDSFRRIDENLRRRGDVDDDRAWLWRRPEGLDIRTRSDLRRFERVLQHVRPDLVCLGPAYKLFTAKKGEDHEQVAADVLARLDQLRTRHRFGLVMEQHAPHGEGRSRELRPFGSSAWLRWPELGIALDPHAGVDNGWPYGHLLRLARWRGDRVTCTWPRYISRGKHLLWLGHYDDQPPSPPSARVA